MSPAHIPAALRRLVAKRARNRCEYCCCLKVTPSFLTNPTTYPLSEDQIRVPDLNRQTKGEQG